MIVITGATGHLGAAIVNNLLDRGVTDLGVSVRDPAKAGDLAARGVRVRHGNFDDAESLRHAFAGADQLLLVSSNAAATGGDPLAQHRAAIAAARDAGVRRIVYTSHIGASANSAFPPMRDHATTEAMLEQSGVAWTALRNGFYAASGLMLMGDWRQSGVIEAPADGKVCWTAHADLAAAAAAILSGGKAIEGPTLPLTAAVALDLADLAVMAAHLSGRPITRTVITDEQLQTRMAARGVPARATAIALGLYQASSAGEFAAIDPMLAQLLGRAPSGMEALIAQKLAA